MERRVVITGLGTTNPIGNSVDEFWKNVKNSECGVDKLARHDSAPYSSKVSAELKDFKPQEKIEKKEIKRMDPYSVYAVYAAIEAMEDAGLKVGEIDPTRIGVVLGNGVGGMGTMEENVVKRIGGKPTHPLLIPKLIPNIAAAMVAIRFNTQGPCYTITTACASGTDAAGDALRLIKDGGADIILTGGTEAPITPISLTGFCSLKALSTKYNDDPKHASRPFDKDRDGFVMGEGAGILVLEELEHAKKRGAKIYAEFAGYGISCDANHLTSPHPEGRGAIAALKMALDTSGFKPEDIDYINAHGTSTPINDPTETLAIKGAFGDHAKKLKVSSTKGMTGHLLGGAGGIEAIALAKAIEDQYFPPTINLQEPGEGCDLDYVPNKGYHGEIRAGFSNSLGFGGHNGIVCFKKYVE